jgi:glycerophosphoryl diester phosphodiesterase
MPLRPLFALCLALAFSAPALAFDDASSARRAHDLGLRLVPWTVDESADMRRLIDWGVDGIITDYPDRLREVMRERGLALPPGVPR